MTGSLAHVPLIGVTGRRSAASQDWVKAVRGEPLDVNMAAYAQAAARAGGVPVCLTREAGAQVAARLDGLLLTGGEDVHPGLYGGAVTRYATVFDRERDEYELELFEAARLRGLPILGICRGTQLINVARGGTLVEHLAGGRP